MIKKCFSWKALDIFLSSLVLFVLVFMVFMVNNTRAATEASVGATVTAQNISIGVSDATVTYGTMAVGTSSDTTSGDLDDTQFAENDGNITATFNIKGQTTPVWGIGNTANSEIYFHKFCISDCDGSPSWTPMTTSYQELTASIGTGITLPFDLQLGTPTSTGTYTEQTVDVSVQAVAP
ncbi:hypothetical protein KKE45_00625 [Patescibacteria group bacterium]|nr:hypothetical protein [Patescibacteria group bacterium]